MDSHFEDAAEDGGIDTPQEVSLLVDARNGERARFSITCGGLGTVNG